MSLAINKRENGAVTILDLSGRITLGDATAFLRDKIRELTRNGQNQILLNMSGVTYIDSSGLGELTAGHTTVSRAGGQLKLVGLSDRFLGLMQVTKLTTVFDIFEEEVYAVLSFG